MWLRMPEQERSSSPHGQSNWERIILALVGATVIVSCASSGRFSFTCAWDAGSTFLKAVPAVDGKHVGIEGVSRYNKAALVTMAFDQRFAIVLVGSSSKGGAALQRRNFGEAVESLTGVEFYSMAGNFIKHGAAQATFGSMHQGEIPVDSDDLIAPYAPRFTFISYGVPKKGDARGHGRQGSFMNTPTRPT